MGRAKGVSGRPLRAAGGRGPHAALLSTTLSQPRPTPTNVFDSNQLRRHDAESGRRAAAGLGSASPSEATPGNEAHGALGGSSRRPLVFFFPPSCSPGRPAPPLRGS